MNDGAHGTVYHCRGTRGDDDHDTEKGSVSVPCASKAANIKTVQGPGGIVKVTVVCT